MSRAARSTDVSQIEVGRLHYKGYEGTAVFDEEDDCFAGTVQGLSDVIHYEGRSVDELKESFRASVDDYLEWCRQRGKQPQLPSAATEAA
ncbi:MAG: type II toxin-antitoxin system HicB family antitoxin [Planctomycetota bacterium]